MVAAAKMAFLAARAKGADLPGAAQAVGVDMTTLGQWIAADPTFRRLDSVAAAIYLRSLESVVLNEAARNPAFLAKVSGRPAFQRAICGVWADFDCASDALP